MAEANRIFDDIAGARPIFTIQTPKGVVRAVELENGMKASVRGFSSQPSRPTIQIEGFGSKTIKIRFA
ncbi:hypothetical protein [Gloeobacter violaceus]|uniref:hypothetical protein n=1 Tax=Gloeobacter violaceus TaxID=33072 RepID=UPI0013E8ED99|nr:hypothetical protein [Gloeobacter violaceus]